MYVTAVLSSTQICNYC